MRRTIALEIDRFLGGGMAYVDFLWTPELVEHIGEHGISQDDFEHVVCHPYSKGYSRSSGLPAVWGYAMEKRQLGRITRELTTAERQRLERHREEIARELPKMATRDQMRKEAREEATLSGQLRRAVHASELSLSVVADQAGITPLVLDEFLTGERTLRSDVMDRLAHVLGCQLSPAP